MRGQRFGVVTALALLALANGHGARAAENTTIVVTIQSFAGAPADSASRLVFMGAFVTACSTDHRYDLAERSVRGFLKWVGAKWEETLAWQHADNDLGTAPAELIARARALGRRLIDSAPHPAAPGTRVAGETGEAR